MLVSVLFPKSSDQHLEATAGTTGSGVAAVVIEGMSTNLHRPMTQYTHFTG